MYHDIFTSFVVMKHSSHSLSNVSLLPELSTQNFSPHLGSKVRSTEKPLQFAIIVQNSIQRTIKYRYKPNGYTESRKV